MTDRQWLEAVEAAVQALEADARLLRKLLEYELDDAPSPPSNVIRDAEKTGPRTPYRVENMKRAYGNARTPAERERIRKLAAVLVKHGHITDDDAATFKR